MQEEKEQRRENGCWFLKQEKKANKSKKKKEKQGWSIACTLEKQSIFSSLLIFSPYHSINAL